MKEFLYIGHYFDEKGNYILKIGTTNNLQRRAKEHTRKYKSNFVYDWYLRLSKYNTLRYEDKNRQRLKEKAIGEYIRNDRFLCRQKPDKITISIRKDYVINL